MTVTVTGGEVVKIIGANGKAEPVASWVIWNNDGSINEIQESTEGKLEVTRGLDFFTQLLDVDDRPTSIEHKRSTTTIRKTYFKYVEVSGVLVRKRVTVEDYNSDGTKRFLTTIYGYYGAEPPAENGGAAAAGKLKFVVQPEGVKRYLTSNGATTLAHGIDPDHPEYECDLDRVSGENSVSDESLDEYAEVVYDAYWKSEDPGYNAECDGEIRLMTGHGGGCCGGSETGQYKFAYGPSSARTPTTPTINDWKTWRRITAPSGLQTVEFYNEKDQVVFRVVQEMDAQHDIAKVWITHYKYYLSGDGSYREMQVKEHRYPSACTGYTYNEEDDASSYEWVKDFDDGANHNDKVDNSGTTGLVHLYDYHDPSGKIAWEKVRQGTSSGQSAYYVRTVTYTSHTYGEDNPTIYLVDNDIRYPTAQTSEVPNPDDREITDYDYTFYADSNAVEFKTVKHPTVSTANNGSNSQTQVVYHYKRLGADTSSDPTDDLYYNDWTKHEDDSYSYTELGTGTWNFGQVVKTVEDVDDTAGLTPPTGWDPPASGRLNLTTTYAYWDATGSYTLLKSVTAPGGQKTVYAYECQRKTVSSKETTTSLVTLVAPHMDNQTPAHYDFAPVQITVADLAGRALISAAGDSSDDEDGDLTDDWDATDEAVADAFVGALCARTDSTYNVQGQLTSTDRYYDVANSKKLTASHAYDATTGLRTKTTAPEGTIAYTVYDQLGRTTAAWMGTDATGATQTNPAGSGSNNLKKIAETYYDQATPGTGSSGVGDGNVTQSKTFYDNSNSYNTAYLYDYRDRLLRTLAADKIMTVRELDNLGRATAVEIYGDVSDVNAALVTTKRWRRSETAYDEKGQVYKTIFYEVNRDPEGELLDRLTTNYWYDPRGRLIKTKDPNGLFSKTAYDGTGRSTAAYLCYDSAETAYADADDVTGDTVVEQTKYHYDDASNVWLAHHFQRHTGATGTGELNDPGGSQPKARVTYAVAWFDTLGRTTKTVFYGDNGGTVIDSKDDDFNSGESGTPAYSAGGPAVNSSDLYIVSTSTFSASTGRLTDTYDNKGTKTAFTYDDLGRTTKTVENYVNGEVGNAEYASDRTTEYEFDSSGRLVTLTARNPKGDTVEAQQTRYLHDSALSAAWPTKIVYPDSSNGMSQNGTTKVWTITSGSDHVAFTYDRLGRKVTSTDQRGVVHTYTYHGNGSAGCAGRLCYDTVTDFGSSNADQRIRRLYYEHNKFGSQIGTIRSYTYDGSYHIADAIWQSINNWGMLQSHYQDHDDIDDNWTDAINVMSIYEDGASGGEAKYVRLDYVSYREGDGTPDARDVYYNYPTSGDGAVMSRLDNLAADGSGTTKYAQYTYLGAGTIAKVTHPAVSGGLNLVYDPDADDSFDGLDRFGRVVDQRWQNSTPTVKDQFKYGYDRASNRTWREVSPDGGNPTGFDEYYTYDGLHRLQKAERGTLAGSPYSSITSHTRRQDFGLEVLGNWKEFKDDAGDGSTWDLDQDRTHNAVNETTGITGGSWIVPGYDAAGNMTSGPKPTDPTVRQHYKWDAWNRMVAVYADNNNEPGDLIAEYRYDAFNRRIAKLIPNGNNWDRTDYYYAGARVVEERFAANQANKETLAVPRKFQYVWDIRYVHAAVLRDADTDSDGDVLDEGGSERLYYTQDANFNVTALVGTDGSVAERYVYDPYGKRTIMEPDWTDPVDWEDSKKNEILFAGYRLDNESGLYRTPYRPYHPTLGRWASRDLEGYLDGFCLYEFTISAPSNVLDWMGAASFRATDPEPKVGDYSSPGDYMAANKDWRERNAQALEAERQARAEEAARKKAEAEAQAKEDATKQPKNCEVVIFWGHNSGASSGPRGSAAREIKEQQASGNSCAGVGVLACNSDGTYSGTPYGIPDFPDCSGGTIGEEGNSKNAGYNPPPQKGVDRVTNNRQGFSALAAAAWKAALEQAKKLAANCQCQCVDNKVYARFKCPDPRRQNDTLNRRYGAMGNDANATLDEYGSPARKYPLCGDEHAFECKEGRVP